MQNRTITLVLPLFLIACASGPPVRGTSVDVPVSDAKTKSVSATLYEPGGGGPFPVVILLNGCAGVGNDAPIFYRVNEDYLPKGIATLVVDSFTRRGINEVCTNAKLLDESIAFRVSDVYAAMEWLSARPEIDSKHIFLQGYSHGAMTAIAATDAQLPQNSHREVAGVVAYYPYCSPSSRFSVPTIILIGRKDDWTPPERCENIVDKTNVEITVYPNALHAFAEPGGYRQFRGHSFAYDAAATNDGQLRALALIQALNK